MCLNLSQLLASIGVRLLPYVWTAYKWAQILCRCLIRMWKAVWIGWQHQTWCLMASYPLQKGPRIPKSGANLTGGMVKGAALPWRWYQWAASNRPWWEPIISFGWSFLRPMLAIPPFQQMYMILVLSTYSYRCGFSTIGNILTTNYNQNFGSSLGQ